MALAAKDKRTLKSLGQKLPDGIQLGTDGMTGGFLGHLARLLDRGELVKVRLGDTDLQGAQRAELATRICAAAGGECVAVVGRTVLIYRANPALAPKDRALKT